MKERVKKLTMQRKDEEDERRNLQVTQVFLITSENMAACASHSFVFMLETFFSSCQKEAKRCREELLVVQERLENSERSAEALRRDLSELGALQSQNQAELHQIRLQAAQTTLQLSQANLNLREGQAAWAKERENLRKNAEVRTPGMDCFLFYYPGTKWCCGPFWYLFFFLVCFIKCVFLFLKC